MACPCCGPLSYCHAPSPCRANIRIKGSWAGAEVLSTTVNDDRPENSCIPKEAGSFSGVGIADIGLGQCTQSGVNYTLVASVRIGVSQNAFGAFAYGSCCNRTGLRTAKIVGGLVAVRLTKGPQLNFAFSKYYQFSFPDLGAAAVITPDGRGEAVGNFTPCDLALGAEVLLATPPRLELVVTNFPEDFCSDAAAIRDSGTGVSFAAVGGPYPKAECPSLCPNPLP